MLEGAVLYCAGAPKTIAEAFDGVLTNVGCTRPRARPPQISS